MLRELKVLFIALVFAFSCKMNPDSNRNYTDESEVYKLHLNVVPGAKYYYEITNQTDVEAAAENKKIKNQNKSTAGVYYQIDKDTSGRFLLTVNYHKIHLYSRTGDNETDLDADNSTGTLNPTERMLGALKGAKINAIISPRGEITNISGYKEIGDKILSNLNTTDTTIKTAAELQWEKLVENSLIKNNMDQLFRIFPDSAVHVGDTWKIDSKPNGDIGLVIKSIYKLKAINDDVAIIQSEGVMVADSSTTSTFGFSGATADLSGKQHAEYEMETKTGMLISCKMNAKVEGNIYAMGQEVPIEIESSLRIKGKKVN